jgi:hypothetical protein
MALAVVPSKAASTDAGSRWHAGLPQPAPCYPERRCCGRRWAAACGYQPYLTRPRPCSWRCCKGRGFASGLHLLTLRPILPHGQEAQTAEALLVDLSPGSAAGVVVIQSADLLHARLKVALAGANHNLEFVSGHKLDQESAGQIPENMIGQLLDDGDLRKLHQMLIEKKPPATADR